MRYLIAFGEFWFDFLVGDRPELLIGPLGGLALVAVLASAGWTALSGPLLVGFVVASGALALLRDLAAARSG